MIKGIGLDVITITRIKELFEKNNQFMTRLLTKEEQEVFNQLGKYRQLEFLAGRFSTKEALAKALGTGIGAQLSLQDITVLNDEKGKPFIICAKVKDKIHVSITHFEDIVISQVILED